MYIERGHPNGGPERNTAAGDGLPVEHLQLRPRVNRALRDLGVETVGDVKAFMLQPQVGTFAYGAELAEAVCQLESCRVDDTIDWPRYWLAREYRIHYLCAALPELDRLNERARTHPVDRETLGLAGATLAGCGYTDLGRLIDGLKHGIHMPPGIGETKLHDFYSRLTDLAREVDEYGELNSLERLAGESAAQDIPVVASELPESVARLPVDVLCVGVKCRLLRQAGYRTVGSLLSVDPALLLKIPSVGRTTVELAVKRARALSAVIIGDQPDWSAWCSMVGLRLVPEHPVRSGRDLLAALPDILRTVAAVGDDPIVSDIVAHRVLPLPGDQMSLEEIAGRHPRSNGRAVSRQRVQQMESHLLKQLAGSLAHGRDLGLGVCFHPEFIRWWKLVATEFSGEEDVSVDHFLGGLASAWGVSLAEIIPFVPAICAIVTGDARLPHQLRCAIRIRPELYGLSDDAAAQPLRRFRLSRRGQLLAKDGIVTLSDLIAFARSERCPADIFGHLDVIADSIEDGEISWLRYRDRLGLHTVPAIPPEGPADFLQDFAATVRIILEAVTPGGRNSQIFWLRTRMPDAARPTLDMMGRQLGTYGSSIKREETELLEWLSEVLLDGYLGRLPCWIDQEWLTLLAEAGEIFDAHSDDFESFGAALAVRWGVTWRQLDPALPSMWAVLTGYPVGRRRSCRYNPAAPSTPHGPARIQLRGFRTVH